MNSDQRYPIFTAIKCNVRGCQEYSTDIIDDVYFDRIFRTFLCEKHRPMSTSGPVDVDIPLDKVRVLYE